MGWPFRRKKEMPSGLWQVCTQCEEYIYLQQVEENLNCCPLCDEHFRVGGPRRIEITADPGSFVEFAADLQPKDVLGFVDGKGPYDQKLVKSQAKTKRNDACIVGHCRIQGIQVVLATLDFDFLGGSMGHVVGEKVALALETALADDLPCIIFSASGGARMHEGALSLMQMAKTSAAVHRFKERGRTPYISVLTHPTTGGVTASYAALGDIIIAEPKALIGFAGPRVIKETIRQDLPDGFQRAEFLVEKGFVDKVVARSDMRETVATILGLTLPC